MSFQAQLVLLLWIPIALFLFIRFSPQRAVIIGFILPWLFLPEKAGFVLSGLPDYAKYSAISYGVLLGTLIFDFRRVTAFRPNWIDLPMVVWCLVPLVSSITTTGIYDGLSAVFRAFVQYGIPYFLGRIYISNLAGLRQLAIGILLGGLIYVPFCLYEIRMSPLLHKSIYGYDATAFVTTIRAGGGYRPKVFMINGLAVGMWMMAATLIAIWLWQSGTLKKLWDIPINWIVVVLLGTFMLGRSLGSYFYLTYGLFTLFFTKSLRRAIPFLALILGIYFYLFLGGSGLFSAEAADRVIEVATEIVGTERADSLKVRLDNDRLLSERNRQRLLFGWGPGQSHMYGITREGEIQSLTITDSLWIIAYGQYGAVGLVAFFSSFLLPAFCFWLRYPARSWFNPKVAPAAVLSVMIALFMVDCAFNAQVNASYLLASGGIAGLVSKKSEIAPGKSRILPKKAVLLQARQQNRRLLLNGNGNRTTNSPPSSKI